jgi:hypothetical protein
MTRDRYLTKQLAPFAAALADASLVVVRLFH